MIVLHIIFMLQKLKHFSKKNGYFSYFCSKHRLWYTLETPRRGGSNEYPQSMLWIKNTEEKYVYPCEPQFYYIKWGSSAYTLHGHVFLMHVEIEISRIAMYHFMLFNHNKGLKSSVKHNFTTVGPM